MPLSMQVTSMPSMVSRTLPVGSSPGATEPAVSRKLTVIGAEVPGAPSMRALPSYSTWPFGVCTVMSHCMSVLSVSTRSVVVSPLGLTMPVSSANGTTAASMLPQLGVVSTVSLSGCSWANRKSRSTPGLLPLDTMPTLEVSGCAPPRPSIWRLSGEPITDSSTLSRVGRSDGKSLALKNGPREVPPRMKRQGIAVCIGFSAQIWNGKAERAGRRIRQLEDRPPFGRLRPHIGIEVGRRAPDRHGAELVECRENRGILEGRQEIGVDLRDQFRRHSRRSQKTPPHRGFVTGYAGFRHGGHVRHRLRAGGGRHRDLANEAAIELAHNFRQWIDAHGDVAGQRRRERRRAALVVNGEDLDARNVVEQFT